MSVFSVIKLRNISPLHLGTGWNSYESSASELHSDTLSAALTAMLAKSQSGIDAKEFMESFTISSAFPFYGNRLFLPKPMGRLKVDFYDSEEVTERKKLKKIKYIELPLWKEMANGKSLKISKEQLVGDFLVGDCNEKDFVFYKSQVELKLPVSRTGDNLAPYYLERKFFSQAAGLYCIVDAEEPTLKKIKELFTMLGESGIGSYKSTGNGQFDIEVEKIELPDIENSNAALLLSQYIPTEEELKSIDFEDSQYELMLRNGYMAGSSKNEFIHLLKKGVYMFKCGSLFTTESRLKGKVVDVTPPWNSSEMHRVMRCGRPFVLPVKRQEL